MPTFVKTSVKVSLSSEHLQEDIQVSIQCQERFMTHIDRCEIFIATFIATFIAPFDGNRLKPNRDQGLSPFTTPIDFSVCYENCESIARFMNLETFQEPQDSSFFAGKVRNRNSFVKKGMKSDNFLKLNTSDIFRGLFSFREHSVGSVGYIATGGRSYRRN